MKKLFTTMIVSMFALTTVRASYTYMEEYSGENGLCVDSDGPSYAFFFDFGDMGNDNIDNAGRDPSNAIPPLALTTDIDDGPGIYDSVLLTADLDCFGGSDVIVERLTVGVTNDEDTWVPVWNQTVSGAGHEINYGLTQEELPLFANFAKFRVKANSGCFSINNVKLTATSCAPPVPEPSSIALLLIGLSGLSAYRKKRMIS